MEARASVAGSCWPEIIPDIQNKNVHVHITSQFKFEVAIAFTIIHLVTLTI